VDLAAEAIKPAPELSGHAHSHFIQGLANAGNGMMILLDVEGLLRQDLGTRTSAGAQAA
jgi:chemotaxis signal transduction protein